MVLGGLLFSLYCNNYPANRTHDEPVIYVDDNMEKAHAKTDKRLEELIQEQADISTKWLDNNN